MIVLYGVLSANQLRPARCFSNPLNQEPRLEAGVLDSSIRAYNPAPTSRSARTMPYSVASRNSIFFLIFFKVLTSSSER